MRKRGVASCESSNVLCNIAQEEIQRRTRTGIVNKGRYHAPGAPPDEKEKPLFLRVVPGSDLPVPHHSLSTSLLCMHSEDMRITRKASLLCLSFKLFARQHPDSMDPAPNSLQTELAKRAAVAAAVADIHTLMRGQRLQPREPAIFNAAPPPSYNAAPPPDQVQAAPPVAAPWGVPPLGAAAAASAVMVSLFMGFEAPQEFNLVSRLQGPGAPRHAALCALFFREIHCQGHLRFETCSCKCLAVDTRVHAECHRCRLSILRPHLKGDVVDAAAAWPRDRPG